MIEQITLLWAASSTLRMGRRRRRMRWQGSHPGANPQVQQLLSASHLDQHHHQKASSYFEMMTVIGCRFCSFAEQSLPVADPALSCCLRDGCDPSNLQLMMRKMMMEILMMRMLRTVRRQKMSPCMI